MDIVDEMQRESKLIYELQNLREQITATERALESLKERRMEIFRDLRNLSEPVPYNDLANLSGMSPTHAHKLAKQAQAQQPILQERNLSLQEQVDLYNAQVKAEQDQ